MLTLPIKKQWFNMILNGDKKEEYRSLTPYYMSRFKNIFEMYPYSKIPTSWDKHWIILRNGYAATSPSIMVYCSLSIGPGNPAWGAEDGEEYYVLSIHEISHVT